MGTGVESIARKARNCPKESFNALMHHFSIDNLRECYQSLDRTKAIGIDGIGKDQYGENLEENLTKLQENLRTQSYRPKPVRRVEIPKDDGTSRPLGICCLEDKIVQEMMRRIVEAIYEPRFIDSSYGFRPNRSCHDALRKVNHEIMAKPVNYLLDMDLSKFFDSMPHRDIVDIFSIRIKDRSFISLLARMLKAGVYTPTGPIYDELGSPQGSIVSPAIANVFLHHVLDLWFKAVVAKHCIGYCEIVRYADDACAFFQYEADAEKFMRVLPKRLEKFGLSLNQSKTKMIPIGKRNAYAKSRSGLRIETFDFLGLTHYWGRSKRGFLRLKRKTSKKRFRRGLVALNQWLKENRNVYPLERIWRIVSSKLRGHINYFGVTDNSDHVKCFLREAKMLLFKWLNRRSQRKSFNWQSFDKYLLKYPLPKQSRVISILPVQQMAGRRGV